MSLRRGGRQRSLSRKTLRRGGAKVTVPNVSAAGTPVLTGRRAAKITAPNVSAEGAPVLTGRLFGIKQRTRSKTCRICRASEKSKNGNQFVKTDNRSFLLCLNYIRADFFLKKPVSFSCKNGTAGGNQEKLKKTGAAQKAIFRAWRKAFPRFQNRKKAVRKKNPG